MCSAIEFFKGHSVEGLSAFLMDAFKKHSHADDAYLDEASHIDMIKKSIKMRFIDDPQNIDLSHEMWAVTTIACQHNREKDQGARMPEILGAAIYNDQTFIEAFRKVRDFMRSAEPQPMRA